MKGVGPGPDGRPPRPLGPLAGLAIQGTVSASRFKVRAKPGTKISKIEGEHGGALKVSIAAPPEKGKANAELVRILAEALRVGRPQVQVISGLATRDKTVAIADLPPEETRLRLQETMGATSA